MGVEQVRAVARLTAQLGVEVQAAGREATGAQDLDHPERHLLDRHREPVDVPAETVVAGVGVDRPEDAGVDGGRDLVGEVVSGERGVVDLDVDLDVLGEVVALQEGVDGGDVVVVLVLRRLERLGLDEDRAGEADVVLVLDDHREEPAELVELAPHVGVEQRLVPLATTPQHVVVATQAMRGFEAMGDLAGRVGEQFGIRVRRRARLVARVREQVGRAPQQLDTGALLVLGGGIDHLVEQRG